MISNVVDSCSSARGTKDTFTEKIADSQPELESGAHASFATYATASINEEVPAQLAPPLPTSLPEGVAESFALSAGALAISAFQPEETINPTGSVVEGFASCFPLNQQRPEQFVLPDAQLSSVTHLDTLAAPQGALTTRDGEKTFTPYLSTETSQVQTAELVGAPAIQKMAPNLGLVGREADLHASISISELQTQGNQTNNSVLAQNHPQTSSLPTKNQHVTQQQFLPQFSANLSGTHTANLNLPLALAEGQMPEPHDSSAQAIASTHRTTAAVSQWGPVPVSASAPLAHQAQEMLSPLREQIRFQVDQQIKHAELRLDPPELGKVELNIRLDGDRLHIQMHAVNASVRDSLLLGLDRLRAELAADHGGQIDVDINQGQKEQREPRSEATVISLASSGDELDTDSSTHDSQQSNQIDLLA